MILKKSAMAGTLESSDIHILIKPNKSNDIDIELDSAVKKQFGKQIIKVIEDTLKDNGVESALIKAVDKGAVDYVIKARVETAIYRSAEKENYNWAGSDIDG